MTQSRKAAKKEHFRSTYREWATSYFELPFGELSDIQRTEALMRFYITEVHNPKNSPIAEDDIDHGIVDGAKDLGIDFIYRNDGQVLILQSKYLSQNKSVLLGEIDHFQTVFNRLLNPKFEKNSRLADLVHDIDFKNDTFVLKFLALGAIGGQAKIQSEETPGYPIDDLADRCDYHFIQESQLTEELRAARMLSGGIPALCELVASGRRGNRTPIIELSDSERKSCVIVVDASQLNNIYREHRDSLFTLNIRNYIGNTATNKLLITTLQNQPEDFYYFNNGISCLAESIDIEEDRVVATKFQIINGAQTVRSLFKVSRKKEYAEALLSSKVLVRITEARVQYGHEGKFRNDIVRFNNTQNVVKISDFRSNDPIHEDIKKRFSRYKRNGKSIAYVPKRTDRRDLSKKSIVPLEEFSKVIYSFLVDPVSFSGRTSFLFDDSTVGGYVHVFGDGSEVFTSMPSDNFQLRSAIWWYSKAVTRQVKSDRANTNDSIEKAALERKWFILFASRLVLERSYQDSSYIPDLCKTYKGNWQFGKGPVGRWLHELYSISKESVVYKYREAAGSSNFVHRNWVRNKNTAESLKTYITSAPIRLARRTKS